jgi:hypothetical protein
MLDGFVSLLPTHVEEVTALPNFVQRLSRKSSGLMRVTRDGTFPDGED